MSWHNFEFKLTLTTYATIMLQKHSKVYAHKPKIYKISFLAWAISFVEIFPAIIGIISITTWLRRNPNLYVRYWPSKLKIKKKPKILLNAEYTHNLKGFIK